MNGKAILLSIVGVYSATGGTEHRPSGAAMALLFVGWTLARLAAGFAGVFAGRAQRQGAA